MHTSSTDIPQHHASHVRMPSYAHVAWVHSSRPAHASRMRMHAAHVPAVPACHASVAHALHGQASLTRTCDLVVHTLA
eukprot:6213620-Pleurochrysis_carterae.AAC.3